MGHAHPAEAQTLDHGRRDQVRLGRGPTRPQNNPGVDTDQRRRARFTRSVGDADNFRLYHTPGFGWRGPLKFRHIPTGYRRGACLDGGAGRIQLI